MSVENFRDWATMFGSLIYFAVLIVGCVSFDLSLIDDRNQGKIYIGIIPSNFQLVVTNRRWLSC